MPNCVGTASDGAASDEDGHTVPSSCMRGCCIGDAECAELSAVPNCTGSTIIGDEGLDDTGCTGRGDVTALVREILEEDIEPGDWEPPGDLESRPGDLRCPPGDLGLNLPGDIGVNAGAATHAGDKVEPPCNLVALSDVATMGTAVVSHGTAVASDGCEEDALLKIIAATHHCGQGNALKGK